MPGEGLIGIAGGVWVWAVNLRILAGGILGGSFDALCSGRRKRGKSVYFHGDFL